MGRRRGFTLIEGLFASAVLVLVLTGLFAHWIGASRRGLRAREVAEAAQIARGEIERAKVFGISGLPSGTYNASNNTATWAGAFVGNAWTAGSTAYFDLAGNRLTGSTGARFKAQITLTDQGLMGKVSGGYVFTLQSERAMAVTVGLVPENTTIFQGGTNLVAGGL